MKNLQSLLIGLILTLAVAWAARILTNLPVFSVMGAMVTAILLGLILRSIAEQRIIPGQAGITFTAKYLLRLGIIIMGVRLDLSDILAAGVPTLLLDLAVIIFAITVIEALGKRLGVAAKLTTLVAVGTGVCGAAAIGAVAPLIKAKDEDVAVSVTIIALLGTIFTVAYTALLPFLNLSPQQFGAFAGSTLHEIAHVIAAAAPDGPDSSDMALVVKLGRVAMLAPVAMFLAWIYARKNGDRVSVHNLPIPWFVFGFIVMSLLKSYNLFSADAIQALTTISLVLLTMAMAAMGLNVKIGQFKQVGAAPVVICLAGSILLSLFGRLLIGALGI